MDIDMRMFDAEMLQLADYMLDGVPSADVGFYGRQNDGGASWHLAADAASPLEQVAIRANRSPSTLSRSSSQVSTGSDASSSSYDNSNPARCAARAVGEVRHFAARLCSPLSELRHPISSSSPLSLRRLESEERDDPLVYSEAEMMAGGGGDAANAVTSTHVKQFGMNPDLSLLMESLLGQGGGLSVIDGDLVDWTASLSREHQCPPPSVQQQSSPINVLDFPDSVVCGNPCAAPLLLQQSGHLDGSLGSEFEVVHMPVAPRSENFSNIMSVGNQTHGHGHHGWMRSEPPGNNDLFYQHLSSNVSFQNCHSVHSSGFQPHAVPQFGIRSEDDFNGIRIVHLLLAGAEAVASLNIDLATVVLVRLKELASRSGSTMQRVAAYFCEGLQCRLEGARGPDKVSEPPNDSLSAFQVLHEVSPYIKFGHFTANQAILEAFEGERRVHIIDYDILEGIQWPSLMQALACRAGGPPHLRITALCRPHVKRALGLTQETGKRLAEFAATFNISFSFHQVRVDNDDELRPTLLKQVKGECLAVNCMVHLPHMPHRSKKAVMSFMKAAHRLSPKVLALVEEELTCSTTSFVGHFFEALHHYSAIFDSLEASLSVESKGRQLVERIFLAPRITSLMTSSNIEAHHGGLILDELVDAPLHWHSLARAAGFIPVRLSVYNLCQAKLLLGLFSDGYKVDEEHNRLLLAWRSKILLAASVWQCSFAT